MHRPQTLAVFTALVALAAAPIAADTFDGLARTDLVRPTEPFATLATGEQVAFDGTTLRRYDAAGALLGDVVTIPADPGYPFAFPSFVAAEPSGGRVLLGRTACDSIFTDCNFGDVWLVDLTSGSATFLALVGGNYDGVIAGSTKAYVSGKPCGFSCGDASVFALDLTMGGATEVVRLAGASGPVAVDAAGNLLVGTVDGGFPPLPGASDLYLFPETLVTSGALLTSGDGFVLASGLEGASDLAIDPATGDVFLAINRFALDGSGNDVTINRVRLVRELDAPIVFEGTAGWTLSNLELTAGDGVARLFPFQPARGGSLQFRAQEFVTFGSVVRSYAPERSTLSATTNASQATLAIQGGGAGSIALFLLGSSAALLPTEVPLHFVGLSHAPFFVGVDPSLMLIDLFGLVLDGQGAATRGYSVPPGFPSGSYSAQAILLDASSQPFATSNVAIL